MFEGRDKCEIAWIFDLRFRKISNSRWRLLDDMVNFISRARILNRCLQFR